MRSKRGIDFWFFALQLAIGNAFLGSFGPAQNLLREDQGTSLTVAGLHGVAVGIGIIIAGATNSPLVHRFGRPRLVWIGAFIYVVGLAALVLFKPIEFTLPATLITTIGAAYLLNTGSTAASEAFGKEAPTVLSQIQGVAMLGFLLGTFIVGTIANYFRGSWRIGMLATLPFIFLLYLLQRKRALTTHVIASGGRERGALSRRYWWGLLSFFFAACAEFAMAFWATALIEDRIDTTGPIATLSIVALGVGIALGRWFGPGALQNYSLDGKLKFVLFFQMIAMMVFWQSHNLALTVAAIFAIGLGISIQFPIFTIRNISLSENRRDLSMGRQGLASGLAVGISPLILGIIGDNAGISRSYLLLPVVIFLSIVIIHFVPSEYQDAEKV